MDRDYVQKHGIVERYLKGLLSPNEQAQFEDHYLECPETLAELERGWMLQQGLRDEHSESDQMRSVPARGRGWFGRNPAIAAAAAALVLLPTLAAVTLYLDNRSLQEEVDALSSPRANVAVVSLEGERSVAATSDDAPDATVTAEDGLVVLEVDPGTLERQAYSVELVPHDKDEALVSIEGLRMDQRGYLVATIPAGQLDEGRYQVQVADEASELVATYALVLSK